MPLTFDEPLEHLELLIPDVIPLTSPEPAGNRLQQSLSLRAELLVLAPPEPGPLPEFQPVLDTVNRDIGVSFPFGVGTQQFKVLRPRFLDGVPTPSGYRLQTLTPFVRHLRPAAPLFRDPVAEVDPTLQEVAGDFCVPLALSERRQRGISTFP